MVGVVEGERKRWEGGEGERGKGKGGHLNEVFRRVMGDVETGRQIGLSLDQANGLAELGCRFALRHRNVRKWML